MIVFIMSRYRINKSNVEPAGHILLFTRNINKYFTKCFPTEVRQGRAQVAA